MPSNKRSLSSSRKAGVPTLREEMKLVSTLAILLTAAALAYCARHGYLLLYGDAVAHLHIARRIFDSLNPGFSQLGSVWLPLPHLLLLPFVQRTDWWQSGLAGAIPSMASYVLACAGIYRLARRWMRPLLAILVFAALALNPGLLYMSVTAMTEPLYLALMIWSAVHLTSFELALREADAAAARRALVRLTLVLIAAVFTRYDGWILGTLAWLMAAYWTLRRGWWKEPANARVFVVCTLLLLAAPLSWLGYNWRMYGDPLDFLRGPYSAKAIAERTTKPGSLPYPGWHHLWWAFLYYVKSAKMGAAPLRCGRWLLLMTAAGTAYAVVQYRSRALPAAILFWLPVPFYAYSVAYGSVPIFLPVWFPHSYYNTRYGMEMLPAFALFPAFAVLAAVNKWPQRKRVIAAFALAIIIAGSAFLLRDTPLVFQEAKANAATRIPFERALAEKLILLPPQATLLMYTSAHVGALQQIGFPLRQTINEGDYKLWHDALADPAAAADYIIAIDGDPVAQAAQKHPQNLELLFVICSTGQPCARIYRSTLGARLEVSPS
ncbi:MAG TPA: hypothetical protein VND66_11180 [Acidobacteriaceae bacterium]|nr:hypothetical protein [Acidobacteriaceae bacterium]